jgi:hypothetical protein
MSLDAMIGLIGGFIAVLVTIMVFMLVGIQKQLDTMAAKLEGKMDVLDHDKQALACTAALKEAVDHVTRRLDDKITVVDRKFCGHSHTAEGRIVLGGGL